MKNNKRKNIEHCLSVALLLAIAFIEAVSPEWVQKFLGWTALVALLVWAAFELGRMWGRAESGCVVYRLDKG